MDPVLLDDAAADGEAEAGATLLAGIGGLDLLEAVEDGVELVGGMRAFVGDLERMESAVASCRCARWRREERT